MISRAVTGVETSCSIVPRSHSRAMVSDESSAPTSAMTSATTPGMMKFRLSRSSLYQVRAFDRERRRRRAVGKPLAPHPVELHILREAADHRGGVADREVGGVVVGGVDDGLHGDAPAVAQPPREVGRDDERELAAAGVDRGGELAVVVDDAFELEVLGGLEALEQRLAVLAAVAVEDVDRNVLRIEASRRSRAGPSA